MGRIPPLEGDDFPSTGVDNGIGRDIAGAVTICIGVVVGAVDDTVETAVGMVALGIAVMDGMAEMGLASGFCGG